MGHFSIKDIERITGIKAHTLRVWEQRYNIPCPGRTATNIRYYNDDDLKLLLNISMLSHHGHRISTISKLSKEEIGEMTLNYCKQADCHTVYLKMLNAAMIHLDESAFEEVFSASILQFGLDKTLTDVVFPFLRNVGELWQTGSVNPAYEHFISNLVRQKLIIAINDLGINQNKSQKKFLLFLPEGESHELGLLFANYLIRSKGHHALYLGQSLSVNELEKVAGKYEPDFLFFSITINMPKGIAELLISECMEKFPNCRLLVTGQFFINMTKTFPEKLHVIKSKEDLELFF